MVRWNKENDGRDRQEDPGSDGTGQDVHDGQDAHDVHDVHDVQDGHGGHAGQAGPDPQDRWRSPEEPWWSAGPLSLEKPRGAEGPEAAGWPPVVPPRGVPGPPDGFRASPPALPDGFRASPPGPPDRTPASPPLPDGFPVPASGLPDLPTLAALPATPPPFPDRGDGYTPPPWSGTSRLPATPPPAGYARGGRFRQVALAVLVFVVVAGLSGLGVWYFGRDSGTGGTAAPSAGAGVKSSASGSRPPTTAGAGPTPGTSPTPGTTPAVPSGYRVVHDPVGYTLDVPEGWTRRQVQGEKAPVVYYDSPSDGRQLQIFALSEDTPAQSLDLAENDPGYGYAKQPGYRAGQRTSGDTWAELSYRYDDADKGPRQVVDHRFQAADGTLYAVRSSGPESLAAALVRGPLTAAVGSFCPTGAQCS